jgi:hypothetical protein
VSTVVGHAGRVPKLAVRVAAGTRALSRVGLCEMLLLATLATASFTKFYFEPMGKIVLSNALAIVYVVVFGVMFVRTRPRRAPRAVLALVGLLAGMGLVYAAGYLNIDSHVGRVQFFKAYAAWGLHGAFVVCTALHLWLGGVPLVRRAVTVFIVGFCCNAAYGIAQLAAFVGAGIDLDAKVIAPLPFSGDGSGGLLYYGGGIYRINGLTRDPNHLGVIVVAPLALAATWMQGRARVAAITVLTAGLVLSLSRSGAVAALAALLVLAWPLRRRLLTRTALIVYAVSVVVAVLSLTWLWATRPDLVNSLIIARLDPSAGSAQTHLRLYGVVPAMLAAAPLVGNGMNSFALLFAQINGGREEFGPHSVFIELLVESGLVGLTLFLVLIGWLVSRCARSGDLRMWGVAAAIVGTMAGNLFYLTTHIIYDEFLYALAIAVPAGMGILYNRSTMATHTHTPNTPISTTAEADVAGLGDGTGTGGSMPPAEHDVELGSVGRRLAKAWWVIALAVAIAIIIGLARSAGESTTHTASATVYVGQPVAPSGALLPTLGSKASTALEIARGDQAIAAAARTADVPAARIRQDLVVTSVQSPLASKLASPPPLVRIAVTDTDAKVATRAAQAIADHLVRETNSYASDKLRELSTQLEELEADATQIEQQRTEALQAARSSSAGERTTWAVLLGSLSRESSTLRSEQAQLRGQQAVARELESSRIIDKPSAITNAEEPRGPMLAMYGFIGLIAGALFGYFLPLRRS